MAEPHHNPLANHMLMSIQKDLAVLKDQNILDETTYNNIIALLPTQASSTPPALPSNTIRPPLPTRKSTTHSPNLAPIPAPRTPSFPKLPVRRTSDLPPQHSQPQPQPPPQQQHANITTTREALSTEPSGPPPPPSYNATVKSKQMAEAIYDYAGEDPTTDLSFRKGDMIEVIEHVNDDWWRGSLKGKSGIFPQNHVTAIPTQKQASPMAQKTKTPVPIPQVYPAPPAPSNHYQQHDQQQPYAYPPPPTMVYHQAPGAGSSTSYNYAPPPMAVAAGGSNNGGAVVAEDKGNGEGGTKVQGMAKKFGSKLGEAAIFGAGATIGSEAVRAIF